MPQTNISKAKAKAAKIGVTVKPSTRKGKKLDVFSKGGEKLASIGDITMSDYNLHGDAERRKRYKQRFEGTRHKRGTPSFFSDRILW